MQRSVHFKSISETSRQRSDISLNMLVFNTTSPKSIMVSVETYFSFHLSSRFLNADRPSSCGMFEYNSTTSVVHKIM